MKYREGINSELARDESMKEILEKLSERQREVFFALKDGGEMCNEQIAETLHIYPHQVTPRVLELREMGLVKFSRYGKSETSGKKVSVWAINKVAIQIQLIYK
jgi:transcription initiation factor IIE alpha subunit